MRGRFILLIVCAQAIFVASAAADDFRGSKWGATRSEVQDAEMKDPAFSQNEMVGYEAKLGDLSVAAIYFFNEEGRLYRGAYVSQESYLNLNGHITDYERLNTLLRQKYSGAAAFDRQWADDLYRDDPSDWGTAISVGHLQYYWDHKTERTRVVHVLDGENFDVRHMVRYDSISLEQKQAAKEKEELLDAL